MKLLIRSCATAGLLLLGCAPVLANSVIVGADASPCTLVWKDAGASGASIMKVTINARGGAGAAARDDSENRATKLNFSVTSNVGVDSMQIVSEATTTTPVAAVPLPPAFWSGLAMIGMMGMVAWRRRRSRMP